ncbi:hypothetical protein F4778DRAFT_602523 [Xylariomycetidae sp. FL2044]|nr:hypothetical protein F4778DRAFT_602523 [Xylariomycetidae sp. FL2044]
MAESITAYITTVFIPHALIVTVTSTETPSSTAASFSEDNDGDEPLPTSWTYNPPYSPLTTIFTPPSSCADRFYGEASHDTVTSGIGDPLFWACQPPQNDERNEFSPGVCPAQMSVASRESAGSTFTDICCQRGFNWWPQIGCGISIDETIIALKWPDILTTDVWMALSQVTALHTPILALWQAKDLSLFPSDIASQRAPVAGIEWGTPETTSSFTISMDSETVTSDPIPTSSPSSNPSVETRTALSKGTIVGIVIACTVFMAMLVTGIWAYRRRRLRCRLAGVPVPELDSTHTSTWKRRFGGTWRAELHAETRPSELPGETDARSQPASPRQSEDVRHDEKGIPVELDATGGNPARAGI